MESSSEGAEIYRYSCTGIRTYMITHVLHLLIIGVHSRKSASPARRVGPEMANVPTLFATAVAAVL